MKITTEHYEFIKNAIQKEFTKDKVNEHREFIKREWDKNKDIVGEYTDKNVDMRLRWDLLWLSVTSPWICDNIYKYAHDMHIDMALKRIVKELF